jgi:hypothetical protein
MPKEQQSAAATLPPPPIPHQNVSERRRRRPRCCCCCCCCSHARMLHEGLDRLDAACSIPIAPKPTAQYGEAAYWDERYKREPVTFDW